MLDRQNALPAIRIAFSELPVIASYAVLNTHENVPFVTRRLRLSFVKSCTADTHTCLSLLKIPTSNSWIINIAFPSKTNKIIPSILACHFFRNYPILMNFFLFFIILNCFSCILTCNKVKIQCIPTKIIHAKLYEKNS